MDRHRKINVARDRASPSIWLILLAVIGASPIEGFVPRNFPASWAVAENFHFKKYASVSDSKTVISESWSYQEYTTRQSELDRSHGVIYRQCVLLTDELKKIQDDVLAANSQMHAETSCIAQDRLGASLPANSGTIQILKEGSLCELVRKVTGDDTMVLSEHLPVQVRSYEKVGASMAWHEDDLLYDPPQIEAVLTLENNSDCKTMWKVGEQIHSTETDRNSVLLLKAGGPIHCVTSLKRGRRVIIKCAYVSSKAKYREGIYNEQFRTAKGKRLKSRKR